MKKILFITAFVPTKIAAAENYTRQLINDLASDYKIDLIYFKYRWNEDFEITSNNINVLKVFNNSRIIKIFNFILTPLLFPLFTVRFNLGRLIYIIKQIKNNNYDLIFLDHSQVFIYGKFVKNTPKILMVHDVETQRFSRKKIFIATRWCQITENYMLNIANSRIFSFSVKDQLIIKQLFSKDSSITSFYLEEQIIQAIPSSIEDYFVLFARWERNDNINGLIWLIENVVPYLDDHINIKIIGGGLNDRNIKQIVRHANIQILGFVDNPYPIIANAKALISPLFTGAGVKVKVIDSLACGTHIIGTEISFEGIPQKYSDYLLETNTKEDFISKINNFNTTLDSKKVLKSMFINNYQNNNLSKYIKSTLSNEQ